MGLDIAARVLLGSRSLRRDLYDFLRYGSQQLGVALATSAAKAVPQRSTVAVAIGILRSLARRSCSPPRCSAT